MVGPVTLRPVGVSGFLAFIDVGSRICSTEDWCADCHPNPMETAPLDPSLPGVRLLQSWIREQLAISIDVIGSERIEGRLVWQDPEFLAIERSPATRPTLINRRHISVIRALG